MSDNTESGMTMSADAEAMLLAVKTRIEAVPAGETLIDTIPDADWTGTEIADWMVNAGSDLEGNSEELDYSDKETAQSVATFSPLWTLEKHWLATCPITPR
tara:strand:- start:299 stop:601 length:303 start_codon:yes stop_codon:yes gene_type:complete